MKVRELMDTLKLYNQEDTVEEGLFENKQGQSSWWVCLFPRK